VTIASTDEVADLDLDHLQSHDSTGDSSSLEQVETRHIQSILQKTDWVIEGDRGAAKILDLHPNTLRSRMKKLGIERGLSESCLCGHEISCPRSRNKLTHEPSWLPPKAIPSAISNVLKISA